MRGKSRNARAAVEAHWCQLFQSRSKLLLSRLGAVSHDELVCSQLSGHVQSVRVKIDDGNASGAADMDQL